MEVNDINIACSVGEDIIAKIPKQLIDFGDELIVFTVKCSPCSPHQLQSIERQYGSEIESSVTHTML